MRWIQSLLLLVLFALLAACASMSNQQDLLHRNQYAWSGAIRWGDFEGAANLIDPLKREEHALSEVELARYKQVQISHYRDLGASQDMEAGTATRDIEIGVVNRHTMTERTVRYREQWRWDEPSKTWWLTSPMPDLWDGE
ncbi:hypothetical protein [Lysobacter sp. A3-1-A15]|uniref:hypothetical protein n=1 Tax=Novilysobacter viscosus TaxID=3098602 RepID=UPI002ED9A5A8